MMIDPDKDKNGVEPSKTIVEIRLVGYKCDP